MESEFDLLKEENARLMGKITGLEFEKAELEARDAELRERVAKLEEKQLENVVKKTYYMHHKYREKHDHISKTIFGRGKSPIMSASEQSTSGPSLSNIRNRGYNIPKNLDDGLVRDKEIPELEPCSECTNNILTFPPKSIYNIIMCHIFHRSCIEKQLLHTKPGACPFPNCGKNVDVIMDPNSTRRGSQSSQSSGISTISNLVNEKAFLTSPTN
ncbi:hypothetical protein RirG_199380 [Rhizophagus irregularis DAOM 197198w]|nr:hypothetical protein RirG_199380 [Rhizophagus irregularis DAOM 197198w]